MSSNLPKSDGGLHFAGQAISRISRFRFTRKPVERESHMRNLDPVPIALLLSGTILFIVGLKTGGSMGRVELIAGEIFMLVGILWIGIKKLRS